ncbi:MAG: glycosyltransferase family 4 protein [Lachnospiraceae bacterium]|nr:glycosyltransferase family 4 protein [Lachnospiraceae bacterium]
MKILIDLTALADNYSGMEHYAESIVKELLKNEKGSDVFYELVFKNEVFKSFLIYEAYENVSFTVLEGKDKLYFNQVVLLKYLNKTKADRYVFIAFPAPLLFRKKNSTSVIFDMVCWDCPETMTTKAKYYFRAGITHAAKISDQIITISEFSKKRIVQRFPKVSDKIHIVYCGVDEQYIEETEKNVTEESLEAVRGKYNLPENYILCLSTVEPRKNMRLLIEAYDELIQEGKITEKLVIVGRKGWKVEKLLEGVSKACTSNIVFTGFVDGEDLPIIYRAAKCFVFPSLYEGFGMPPLEAMACGTKVLASDIEVAKEVLGNYVFYFESGDKQSLCDKLVEIGEVQAISDAKDCVLKYSWRKEAEKMRKLLQAD